MMMMEGREPGSGLLHQHHGSAPGSKKPSPLSLCHGGAGGEDTVPSSNKLIDIFNYTHSWFVLLSTSYPSNSEINSING